jgi:hypothetical protein
MKLPAWVPAVDRFGAALVGAVLGIVSVVWQARGVIEGQTTAIAAQAAATASLRQTIDETIRPTLAKVEVLGLRVEAHGIRIAVIESTCCGPVASGAAPSNIGSNQ